MTTEPNIHSAAATSPDTTTPLDAAPLDAVTLDPPHIPTAPTLPIAPAPSGTFVAASPSGPGDLAAEYPPARVRWAGIVWGAFFATLAALALPVLTDASRRSAIHDALLGLSPATVNPGAIVGFVVLGIGVLTLIAGGVALLRRAQLRTTIGR
jgi:hypothetical protein